MVCVREVEMCGVLMSTSDTSVDGVYMSERSKNLLS